MYQILPHELGFLLTTIEVFYPNHHVTRNRFPKNIVIELQGNPGNPRNLHKIPLWWEMGGNHLINLQTISLVKLTEINPVLVHPEVAPCVKCFFISKAKTPKNLLIIRGP